MSRGHRWVGLAVLCLAAMNSWAEDTNESMTPPGFDIPIAEVTNAVLLDGAGHDAVWSRARTLPPLMLSAGKPERADRTSTVRAVRAGSWLLLALDANEPDGIVAQESLHGADLWFDDSFGIQLKGSQSVEILVNPLGSLWCNVNGTTDAAPILRSAILSSARITKGHWRAEVAVDLRELEKDGQFPANTTLRIYRQRQQRGLTPFEETSVPPSNQSLLVPLPTAELAKTVRVTAALPEHFFGAAVIDAGRCNAAPADAAAWSMLPATLLREDSGNTPLDPEFQTTEVRAALTRDALLLRIVCHEDHPELLKDGDGGVWNQDNLEVFVGPERFGYLQVAFNPFEKVETSRGKTGGKNVKPIPIPPGVSAKVVRGADAWTVDLTIPLNSVYATLALPSPRSPEVYPWWIQISRTRTPRETLSQAEQISLLSVTRSATGHCPLRFATLRIVDASAQPIASPVLERPELPAAVLSAERRKELKSTKMLESWITARKTKFNQQYEETFAKIDNADAWTAFAAKIRADLMRAMFPESGGKLPERTPLDARTVFTKTADGFQIQGILFQSRPGLLVPATLYLPLEAAKDGAQRPALIIIPAHHTPRNNSDLQVLGANFARAGGVVLAIESLGTGERSTIAAWEHQSYQRNEIGTQLLLAGTELAGWTAWDVSRAVDCLLQRGDIDAKRVGIVGGVAGGGDLSALAAVVDDRISLSVPFNFVMPRPFGGYWDPCRTYMGANSGGYTPWMVNALIAPRRLIVAQEFDWKPELQSAFERFQKVYAWLGAEKNLAMLHGGVNTHATHFNTMHRLPMYRIINEWWGMKLPEKDADEYRKTVPVPSLECTTTPDGVAYRDELDAAKKLREPLQIATEMMRAHLAKARGPHDSSVVGEPIDRLLSTSKPGAFDSKSVVVTPQKPWRGASVDGIWIPIEDGQLGLALWLLKPAAAKTPTPLVLCVAQAGKARFLAARAGEVQSLLNAGVAVALLDVRGCGETAANPNQLPEGATASLATELWMQNDSLPVRQLQDVRTALRFLATRDGIDASHLALWGEALNEPDGSSDEPVLFDETGFRQTGPSPRQYVEPAGGWLALMAAQYPVELDGKSIPIKAVLARGTVASFASILDRRYHYLPVDAAIPGLLSVADVSDVVSSLQDKTNVLAEDLRDCSNRSLSVERVKDAWNGYAPRDYSSFPTPRATERLIQALKR